MLMKRLLRDIAIAVALLVFVSALQATAASAEVLTLSEAVDRALGFAPSVAIAAAQSDLGRARTAEQRSPLFPAISAGTEYYQAPGYSEVITNRGLSASMVTLDYTAWDWGRRTAQYRAARYASEAATLGVAAARAQIVFDT
ncbi:MAG TPA: TolC family protein, partial [Candidatus Binataceae bacterium]